MRRAALALVATGCAWVSAQDHADRLTLLDRDQDGFLDAARGGDDCDDLDPEVHPGADETCARPIDEDCDGQIDGSDPTLVDGELLAVDSDGDGFGAVGSLMVRCPGRGLVASDEDCDDSDPLTYPGAPEACPDFGPDRDCSDERLPCSIEARDLEVALQQPGLRDAIAAGGGWFAVHDGEAVAAYAADVELPPWPGDRALDAPGRVGLAGGDDGLIVATPEEGDRGTVRVLRPGAPKWEVAPKPPAALDVVVGWGAGSCGAAPVAILYGRSWPEMGWACPTWEVGGRVDRATDGLATRRDGDAAWIAVASTAASGGNGGVDVWVGGGGRAAEVGALRGQGGEGFGRALTWADLDRDGEPELLVGASGSWMVFPGPVDRTARRDAPRVEKATDTPVNALAAGDLNGDGVLDVAVGRPEARNGAGEVQIYLSDGTLLACDGPWAVTVAGSTLGDRLGAGLTFVPSSDPLGVDDLLITAPGAARVWRLRGSPRW